MSKIVYEKIVIEAIKATSEKLLKEKPEIEKLSDEKSPIRVGDFNTILGIVGDISGQIVFGFKAGTTNRIVSKMMHREVKENTELCISGVAEFTNILSGNAVTELFEDLGGEISITPPSIVMGKEVMISTTVKEISSYKIIYKSIGEIMMYIAIKELDNK